MGWPYHSFDCDLLLSLARSHQHVGRYSSTASTLAALYSTPQYNMVYIVKMLIIDTLHLQSEQLVQGNARTYKCNMVQRY